MNHPMQPIELAPDGVVRFKHNAIIAYVQRSKRPMDLNELAQMDFPAEDWMQLAQLLGYSVSGYGDLSYASAESIEAADREAEKLLAPSITVVAAGDPEPGPRAGPV